MPRARLFREAWPADGCTGKDASLPEWGGSFGRGRREFEDGWVYLGQFVCVFVSVVPGMEPKACSMAGEHSATEPCSNSMRAPYIWGLYGS